jgi:DnaA family protein
MNPSPAQVPLRLQAGASPSLDDFIPGPNAAALAAVRAAVAGEPGPVFLWGENGVGKSHLLQAACQAMDARGRRAALLALGSAPAPALLEGWEVLDLIALDDVDRIAGDRDWEHALFGLFERARDLQRGLLVTARHAPAALALSLPDLRSRFGWGPVYQLRPLDDAGRLAALRARAEARGLELPEETGWFLLSRYARDMHALARMLDAFDAAALGAQRRLTIPFVRSVFPPP